MLVKIFKRRHNGSPKASIDYLLGKERDREEARILRGDPELSLHLAESLLFKNKYTVGCLSFEESNLDEKTKQALMDSFEVMIFAGLSGEQYNISWIEHTDKGRLELNFFIPNVELTTQKRLQPYYHKNDKPLVDSWIQIQNDKYSLSDPHHPAKQQLNKIEFSHDTKHADIKKQIGDTVEQGIIQGLITSRQDVIELLKSAGFTLSRTTEKSLSVTHPSLNKNLRLTGVIYEDRAFDRSFITAFNDETTAYQSDTRNRIERAQTKFDEALKRRAGFNQRTYQATAKTALQTDDNRADIRRTNHINPDAFVINRLSKQPNERPIQRVPLLPRNYRQDEQQRARSTQNIRIGQLTTTHASKDGWKNISEQKWNLSVRDLQTIGVNYAKRISKRIEQLFNAIRERYTDVTTRKQQIMDVEQRIKASKRTINHALQSITDANRAITQAFQLTRQQTKHKKQTHIER